MTRYCRTLPRRTTSYSTPARESAHSLDLQTRIRAPVPSGLEDVASREHREQASIEHRLPRRPAEQLRHLRHEFWVDQGDIGKQ